MKHHFYTREETLEFIDHLRRKDHVIIDSQFIPHKSFFNWTSGGTIYNTNRDARDYLQIIQKSHSTLEAYENIAHLQGKRNVLWRTFPEGGYMFKEDWEEYENQHPRPLPEHIVKWKLKASDRCSGSLESRAHLFELFPTESLIFRHRFEDLSEQQMTVTEVSAAGLDNGYGVERNETEKINRWIREEVSPSSNQMTLCFATSASGLEKDEVLSMVNDLFQYLEVDMIQVVDYDRDELEEFRRKE